MRVLDGNIGKEGCNDDQIKGSFLYCKELGLGMVDVVAGEAFLRSDCSLNVINAFFN
jgi:hypothetical protein